MSNILFFAAHPDDLEVCAGGTIARHANNGDSVSVIIGFTPQASIRISELKSAAEYFPYKYKAYRFGGVPRREALSMIESDFCSSDFDRIYTMSSSDSHQEHVYMADICLSFARENTCDVIMCHNAIPGGISYNSFGPNMYIDISDYIDNKIESIKLHKSQLDKYSSDGKEWLESVVARDRSSGMIIGTEYAEAFRVVKVVER